MSTDGNVPPSQAFEKYKGAQVTRGVCKRCSGAPVAGMVEVTLFGANQKGARTRRIIGRSRSLCETCCVEVYDAIVAEHQAAVGF